MIKDLLIYIGLAFICLFVLSCTNVKDVKEAIEKARQEVEANKNEFIKKKDKKSKLVVVSPRVQMEDDFSLFKYLFLLIAAIGAGAAGFGAWLKDKGMIGAGILLFLMGIGAPVCVYVFKVAAVPIAWSVCAIVIILGGWFIISLIKYIKEDHDDFETVVESLDLVVEHGWENGKDKVAKIQDKRLQDRVDTTQDKIAVKNATKTRPITGD